MEIQTSIIYVYYHCHYSLLSLTIKIEKILDVFLKQNMKTKHCICLNKRSDNTYLQENYPRLF